MMHLVAIFVATLAAAPPPVTGRQTEERFPRLQVPPGFTATLFACDPLVEYPSAIAVGPRPGSVFVAIDYMTGWGTEIIRRDEIRLVEDMDGDGYADRTTLYASGFNSIEGLTSHAGAVYVMHAPMLTALTDSDGNGVADERRDLLIGLGLPPEDNAVRLHCANGIVMGHDGWLYLALGDHGCNVVRPEGDRLILEGGGVLRCRPDGSDLHVFVTGLRNIYDVALDAELNVFVRDNENDGGDYKIRVCHSFFGADHGYPYLYYERPDEAMAPLADLGLGSSAGGACYLERAFPASFRGNLFFCEWGRSVVRYRPELRGSSFQPLEEIEFASGAQTDPYGFKPTDLVVHQDGSLFVADWADGQRPQRGRGRIYRITYDDHARSANGGQNRNIATSSSTRSFDEWIAQLDSTSQHERIEAQTAIQTHGHEGVAALNRALGEGRIGVQGRLHAIWVLARSGDRRQIEALFAIAERDGSSKVRAQALRALADLFDPVFLTHRLDAGPGDPATAERITTVAFGPDPRVLREAVIAVGRLGWSGAPEWLRQTLHNPDPALAHAAMQTLRRSRNWPAVLKLLDARDGNPVRSLALRAIAERFEPEVVNGLIGRLRSESDATRRREYADALTRVYRKPGPWQYWGYRPPPRPPNPVAWELTDRIEIALNDILADADPTFPTVRFHTLRRMQREEIPTRMATLTHWLRTERRPNAVAAILESLQDGSASALEGPLRAVVVGRSHAVENRLAALAMLIGSPDSLNGERLWELARELEDGLVLADVLEQMTQHHGPAQTGWLLGMLSAETPEVRAAAVDVLSALDGSQAGGPIRGLLGDRDARVRRAAVSALGQLGARGAVEALVSRTQDADPGVRQASLNALRLLREPRVVGLAVAALRDNETRLTALDCIGELGGPSQAPVITELAKQSRARDVLSKVVEILTAWQEKQVFDSPIYGALDEAVAKVHGTSGVLQRWKVLGPLTEETARGVLERATHSQAEASGWRTVSSTGIENSVELAPTEWPGKAVWIARSDATVSVRTQARFLGSSSGTLGVWLNGAEVYRRERADSGRPDSDRFDVTLREGRNRLVVAVSVVNGPAAFHLRFRRRSSVVEHERLTKAALTRSGNARRGRAVFLDAEKSQCTKCHRLGDAGERIGPDLTGVGSRFSRIHLIESILEPSRTIAPSYESIAVRLQGGHMLTGVPVAENHTTLTLADTQGQRHEIVKTEIEEQEPQPLSIMPAGLEQGMSLDAFVDLIAFLASQREAVARSAQ